MQTGRKEKRGIEERCGRRKVGSNNGKGGLGETGRPGK